MQGPVPQRQLGDAADSIRCAEAHLAHQNSAVAQIDLQVINAILNAHLQTVQGRDALDRLQQDIQAAIRTRTDLDTPSGARDMQRFLIGKLRDIRAVVADTGLDDTSKSALMAAWTSLYDSSRTLDSPDSPAPGKAPTALPEAEMDPYLDSLVDDYPDLMSTDPAPRGDAAMPMPPTMPGFPGLGGGAVPGSIPPLGMPGAMPSPGSAPELGRGSSEPVDDVPEDLLREEDRGSADADQPGSDDDAPAPSAAAEAPPPSGPTTVTLPSGETVTAASPQLAAAIKAAASGTPIPDAFRQQGITIPPAGTAVTEPIDPERVVPGDIGMFTDHHALALGNSKALLNGQIQHISTVKGPSFLGWEHPPAPVSAAAPARPEAPAPTRPAGG